MIDSDSDVYIPEEPKENVLVRWLLHPIVLLVVAGGISLYIAGSQLWSLLPNLSGRPEYRLRADEIRFTEIPSWVPKTFLQQVIREGGLSEEMSLLDDGLVDLVAAAFQKNPWVERVVSVRKDFTRRVTVSLEYRKPVAWVVMPAERYPIDRNAVLLPLPDSPQNAGELPVIQHAKTKPQGPVGRPWGDRVVEGAARLAEILGSAWKKLKLESIDIVEPTTSGGAQTETIYELATIGGSRIVWGRAPGSDHPGELTPEQKIGRMEDYQTRHGGFSDAGGPYEIDIRHWQEITRQPLSERDAPARQ